MVFGTKGPYVTSDLQFAQQVVTLLRTYENKAAAETLNPDLAMRINSRFFVDENSKYGHTQREMIASSLHLELDEQL